MKEPAGAPARKSAKTDVTTQNSTPHGAQVAIYKSTFDEKTDGDCLAAGATRTWLAGSYKAGDLVRVRAEVRSGPACGGATVYIAEITREIGSGPVFTLRPGNGDYYWDYESD